MLEILENCTLCPHECKVNRKNGKIGRCKSKDTVKLPYIQHITLKNRV